MRDLEGGGATKPHTFPFLRDSSVADATRRFSSCRLSNSTQDLVRCVVPLPRCTPVLSTHDDEEKDDDDVEGGNRRRLRSLRDNVLSSSRVDTSGEESVSDDATLKNARRVQRSRGNVSYTYFFFPRPTWQFWYVDRIRYYTMSLERQKVSVFSICVIDTKRLWRGSIEIIALEDIALTGKNLSR